MITINPPGGLFGVDQFNVTDGFLFAGDLPDLQAAGGDGVSIFNDEVSLRGRLEVRGTSPLATPSSLSFYWFTSVARPGLSEGAEILDTTTGLWVPAAGRVAPTVNSYGSAQALTNPARFVGANRRVRCAFVWEPINDEDPAQDGWLQFLDFAVWRVAP